MNPAEQRINSPAKPRQVIPPPQQQLIPIPHPQEIVQRTAQTAKAQEGYQSFLIPQQKVQEPVDQNP